MFCMQIDEHINMPHWYCRVALHVAFVTVSKKTQYSFVKKPRVIPESLTHLCVNSTLCVCVLP